MDIRKFRSAVARLKKAGLVSPALDARSVRPTRALKAAVERHKDVVAGRAASVPVRRLDARVADLKQHYEIASPKGLPRRVIIPHFPDEKVVSRKGLVEYRSDEGLRRLELPRFDEKRSLQDYFKRILKKKFPEQPRGMKLGAQFFSGRTRTYSSLADLVNKVSGYETVRRAHSLKDKLEVIRNFAVVITPDPRNFKKKKRKGK